SASTMNETRSDCPPSTSAHLVWMERMIRAFMAASDGGPDAAALGLGWLRAGADFAGGAGSTRGAGSAVGVAVAASIGAAVGSGFSTVPCSAGTVGLGSGGGVGSTTTASVREGESTGGVVLGEATSGDPASSFEEDSLRTASAPSTSPSAITSPPTPIHSPYQGPERA